MPITETEKDKLYRQFYHLMGAPMRAVELDDEMLDSYLEMAIEDYAQRVQEWLIEHQWQSVLGQNVDTTDMSFALSVRSFDYVTQFTYAYSKQVGLQSRGPWELKKDFINLEAGRQVYQIPAGREVNEVLWFTPPTTDAALFATSYAGYGVFPGFGSAASSSYANGGAGGFGGGYYLAPASDVLLTAQDLNLKNRLYNSDLIYKITAGPDGTKLLHLISTPGSNLDFGYAGFSGSRYGLGGCVIWYFYYDTTSENVDDCKKQNKDIIKYPSDVPLSRLDYSDFNEPTKTLIRQLFISYAKEGLAKVWGKYGGIIGVEGAERTLNFESLMNEAFDEREKVFERLDERLLRLSSEKQLERAASEAELINKQLQYRPLGLYVK